MNMMAAMCGGSSPIVVAVGSSGAISWSEDGKKWVDASTGSTNWQSVCWCNSLQKFCAVSSTSAANNIMTSTDGKTWTTHSAGTNKAWMNVAWSESLGLCVGLSSGGTTSAAFSSSDLSTFTNRNQSSATFTITIGDRSCSWSPGLAIFAAVGNTGGGNNMSSTNGTAWTSRTITGVTRSSAWGYVPAVFGAVGTSANSSSTNGTAWTSRTNAVDSKSVAWSPERALFAGVGAVSAFVQTSPDAVTWTARTGTVTSNSVCWSGNLSLFIAVGASTVMTSPDGITWSSQTIGASTWNSVCSNDTFHGNGAS